MGKTDFGWALDMLKAGKKVTRGGWNGRGMWLQLIESNDYDIADGLVGMIPLLPWIGMKTAVGCFVPWLASQTDMLAEDWGLWGLVDG